MATDLFALFAMLFGPLVLVVAAVVVVSLVLIAGAAAILNIFT